MVRVANVPTQIGRYKAILHAFMEFVHKNKYNKGRTFKNRERLKITPHHVYEFMCKKVYGKLNPTNDDNPTLGRSSSLEYDKKEISSFMPNNIQAWDINTKCGNPTKSRIVNQLIKAVKKRK